MYRTGLQTHSVLAEINFNFLDCDIQLNKPLSSGSTFLNTCSHISSHLEVDLLNYAHRLMKRRKSFMLYYTKWNFLHKCQCSYRECRYCHYCPRSASVHCLSEACPLLVACHEKGCYWRQNIIWITVSIYMGESICEPQRLFADCFRRSDKETVRNGDSPI